MFDSRRLEIFNAVLEAGSFSRAAERLYLTQSAVSQHIQELEAALNTRLFEREPRGVRLTLAGEILRDYTRCILSLMAEAKHAVMNLEGLSTGQLRIGATPGVGGYVLPDWIQPFRVRYPQFMVSLQTDVTTRITTAILNRTLDIGFIEGELDGDRALSILVLESIPQGVAVGQQHPWYGQESVPVDSLRGQPFIVRPPHSQTRIWLDQLLARHRVQPTIAAELDSPEAIKQAVIAGMGISVLPEYVIRHERDLGLIHLLTVSGADMQRDLKLVWANRAALSPMVRAFLLHLSNQYPQVKQLLAEFPPLGDGASWSGLPPDACPR